MARTDQPHKLTFDAFVAKATNLEDPINSKHANLDYTRPETRAAWGGSKVKVPIWCNTCAAFFTQQPANHMNGQGCPACGVALRTEKRRKKDPIADFRKAHGDRYDYSAVEYDNTHAQVTIICREHGPFKQKPGNHIRGDGCPACWANRKLAFAKTRTVDYREGFAERAARVHGGAYALIRAPETSHDTVVLNCPKHGDFEQKAFSHLDGHGCPICGANVSNAQKEVTAFIEALGVTVERENRTVLGGLHIDIWAAERGIGVEYHGTYWHTQNRVGNKHREKWERAEAAGIQLVQLFDFEWLERRTAAENRLRALFGAGPAAAARKCDLRPVTAAEANAFCKEHHTQGSGLRHKAAYGLYLGDDLVACMTFGLSRYSTEGWELLRFASKGRVHGGFSRLMKAFLCEHQPERIVSYCDLRWGNGGVYARNGFTLDGVTPPDYWYTSRDRRVSRYAAQHRPKGQTEREWAEEHGYEKVLGVGHQRWVWTPPG